MFASSRDADQAYDFDSEENATKWRNLLINSLLKVQFQVHPSLNAKDDALRYVETLIFRLLGMLCAAQPHTVQDVEERVQKTFPHPIDKWAIGDAQSAIEKGKKKSPLVLPVEKIHPLLQKEILGYKVDLQVTQYIVAVLEYISADILKLAGNYVKNIRHVEITCQDIKVAMCADKVLMDMFYQDEDVSLSIEEEPTRRTSLTYDEVVKDLIHEEKQYIRDLNMIIKVFREPFVPIFHKKELDVIFSNILEIYDFSVSLLGTFEDALEMAEENQYPSIGACYEELAEYQEFDVYDKYAHDILNNDNKEKMMTLIQQPNIRQSLQFAGHGFTQAVKYVLPKLLLGPVFHCFQYFDFLKVLKKLSPCPEDQESLTQAEGVFSVLKTELERLCSSILPKRKQGEQFSRMYAKGNRQASIQRMNDLQRSIDGWEGKDIGQCCNDFVMDGILGKVGSGGRRLTERQVFLFDGLMVLCKPNNKRSSVTGPVAEFRLKEKYYLRKIEIIDKDDTDELKNAFEIAPRDQLHIVLFTKTAEEKSNWMAHLIMLNTKSMLERTLDSILLDEEKKHPLRLPTVDKYKFAVEDSESNIIFEENKSKAGVPIIKGATLTKLVERLTYHMYADPMFVRTFLTTYRSFCQPLELLDLLIERFEIEDPPPPEGMLDLSLDGTMIENYKNSYREDIKRFKKEYCQPVQFRVLNVLRHWVDHHFYDFERDPSLLVALRSFLEDKVKGKSMRKWVESINKVIVRRQETVEETKEFTFGFEKTPPPIEWFLSNTYEKFDLLTLHPIEIARQLTLLEFELYRSVKPSELVGSVWTKKDKMKTSPNLLKLIHHSSNFSFWLMKCIVETENFEERVAVVSRVLEVMIVLQELNNFTGVLEVVGAMNSACVHRLDFTLSSIKYNLKKSLEEAQELNSDHFKKYQEKLRSINPPCVPFCGMYLTNILHIEVGNPDFMPNSEDLINFSKRRKVAEITGEIQQYQNQPYCLTIQPDIRRFLENLDPLEGRTDKAFNDYLYDKSLEIEPRNCKQPPKFSRKWPDLPLKSPGIKPRLSRSGHHPSSLPTDQSRSFSISSSQINQDDEDGQSFVVTPPNNPSTPLTPPFSATGFNSDHSIFAPVMIGTGTLPLSDPLISYPSSPSFSNTSSFPLNPPPLLPPALPPPPLPPRRKRESSVGDTSPCTKQATDAPLLPPRETSPPPLPPRRDMTLPRMHSSYRPPGGWANERPPGGWANERPPGGWANERPPGGWANERPPGGWANERPPGGWANEVTLPRRNSAQDVSTFPMNAPRRLSQSSMNEGSPVGGATGGGAHFPPLDNAIQLMPPPSRNTPQLPPKTHRTLLTNNHSPR